MISLNTLNPIKERIQSNFAKDYTLSGLRLLIIAWALFVIALAIIVDNKWILAGILAWEVLP